MSGADDWIQRETERLRAALAEKESASSVGGSTPEMDDLALRLNLADDGELSAYAEAAVRQDGSNGEGLEAHLHTAFWSVGDGLDVATSERAMRNADDSMLVILRSLSSLTSAGCVTSTSALMLLAELRVLRKEQRSRDEEFLALQQRQVALLERLTVRSIGELVPVDEDAELESVSDHVSEGLARERIPAGVDEGESASDMFSRRARAARERNSRRGLER